MDNMFICIDTTVNKSAIHQFKNFLQKYPEVTKWFMCSDYCIADTKKPNDVVSFVLYPYILDFNEWNEVVSSMQKTDLKHCRQVSPSFCDFTKEGYFFSFNFILRENNILRKLDEKASLSAFENAGGRAQKFLKLTERYAAFTDLTPAILNEFISRIEVHERDKKRAKQAIQHIGIYFNYIGKFENEVTQLTEPTEQEIRQMREKIEEAQKEKSRAYHRQYSREYRARNLEKRREYDRMKAREYRAKKKAQEAAAAPAQ